MHPETPNHATQVAAWWEPKAAHLSAPQSVTLFQRALDALWQRAARTLGEVTLAAIGDRVLVIASEKYPFLSSLKTGAAGVSFDAFRLSEAEAQDHRLGDGACFVLVEFLTLIGSLTGEIMTPALHAELSRVVIDEPTHPSKRTKRGPRVGRSRDSRAQGANS